MMALMTKLECNGVPCHCQKYWTSRSPSHRWLARTLLSTSFHHLQYPTYLIKWARALPTIQCMFGGLMWEHYLSMKIDYLSSPTFGAWWHEMGNMEWLSMQGLTEMKGHPKHHDFQRKSGSVWQRFFHHHLLHCWKWCAVPCGILLSAYVSWITLWHWKSKLPKIMKSGSYLVKK